jgi:hypothetical protein
VAERTFILYSGSVHFPATTRIIRREKKNNPAQVGVEDDCKDFDGGDVPFYGAMTIMAFENSSSPVCSFSSGSLMNNPLFDERSQYITSQYINTAYYKTSQSSDLPL